MMRFLGSTFRSRELRRNSKELLCRSACRKLRAIVESVARQEAARLAPGGQGSERWRCQDGGLSARLHGAGGHARVNLVGGTVEESCVRGRGRVRIGVRVGVRVRAAPLCARTGADEAP